MSHKSFWDSLGDTISFVLFIKYGLPILIVLIIGLIGFQGIYGSITEKKYEGMENVIVSSKSDDFIGDIAKKVLNNNNFSEIIINKYSDFYSLEIKYTFANPDKTAEEYDSMIKDELTKIFNQIKDYKIKNNQIFGANDDEIKQEIALSFYYPKENGNKSYLASSRIRYTAEKGFDVSVYESELNKTIVTDEKIEDAKKRSY